MPSPQPNSCSGIRQSTDLPPMATRQTPSAGTVHALQICPGHRKPMRPLDRCTVIENRGLENDLHALPDSQRQVLLIEKETLDLLGLAPGEVKENVTTKGILLMALKRGDRLMVGEKVMLEITKSCSPCSRMEEIKPGLLRALSGKRGMLARVLTGGTIAPGDPIRLLDR